MVMARGGNRKTKYHKCPKCGKKKYYITGNYKCGFYCKCQYCDYANLSRIEVDRLQNEEVNEEVLK